MQYNKEKKKKKKETTYLNKENYLNKSMTKMIFLLPSLIFNPLLR